MHFNDLVFSSPLDWKAHAGAGADTSVLDALHWKVISSGIDKSGRTMSTLYGNDIAVAAARKGMGYPRGAQLAYVTWKQKEDEHWYGANVPDSLVSVDKLTFDKDVARPDWKHYSGHPLARVSYPDTAYNEYIMKYITGQKASVMP
jgi:hypothetical protein